MPSYGPTRSGRSLRDKPSGLKEPRPGARRDRVITSPPIVDRWQCLHCSNVWFDFPGECGREWILVQVAEHLVVKHVVYVTKAGGEPEQLEVVSYTYVEGPDGNPERHTVTDLEAGL